MSQLILRNNQLKFTTSSPKVTDRFRGIGGLYLELLEKEKPNHPGNTSISTDWAQKSPRTLPLTTPMKKEDGPLGTDELVEFEE